MLQSKGGAKEHPGPRVRVQRCGWGAQSGTAGTILTAALSTTDGRGGGFISAAVFQAEPVIPHGSEHPRTPGRRRLRVPWDTLQGQALVMLH